MKRKLLVNLIALFTLMLLIVPAAQARSFGAEVISGRMACYSRQTASKRYYLGSLKKGAHVTVLSHGRRWAKIQYRNRVGYARIEDMAAFRRVRRYAKRRVTAYQGTSPISTVVGTLKRGTAVYVVGSKDGYRLIENESGSKRAYVPADSLSRTKP